jgi:plastocyanin
MPRRRVRLPAAGLLLALVIGTGLAACGGDGGASATGGGTTEAPSGGLSSGGGGDDTPAGAPDDVVVVDGATATVNALDNTFQAPDIQVKPGTTVTWTNKGRNDHDVLPVDGDAWGVDTTGFTPGAVYSTTFTTPGVYHYYCSIHGTTTAGMVGTVVVAG